MAIPSYEQIMLPLLTLISDQKEYSIKEAVLYLAEAFNLTDDEKMLKLPSGYHTVFNNRVSWARTYLMKAGFIRYTRRSYYTITVAGLQFLSRQPSNLSLSDLKQIPGFVNFYRGSKKN